MMMAHQFEVKTGERFRDIADAGAQNEQHNRGIPCMSGDLRNMHNAGSRAEVEPAR